MKSIVKKYLDTPLILRIACGLALGIILGYCLPQLSFISEFGTIFKGALKSIAPILVFLLVSSSLANAGKGLGSRFRSVIFYYMLSTLLAAFVAVVLSFLFPVNVPLTGVEVTEQSAPAGLGEVFATLLNNMVANPIDAMVDANYVGVLTWAVIFGLALRSIANDTTKKVLTDFADAVSKSVGWIIQFAPFGIMGLVFASVNEYGLEIFTTYGKLLALLVGCMLLVALVIDPLIVAVTLKRNPYPLVFRCFRESGITAFFTRSSAANIPVNMELCKNLGLDEDYYSVAIPLGATINMDGAAITITILSLAAANSLGIQVSFISAVLLSFISTLGACGASGVAGGSLLLIPMACSMLGVSQDVALQMVGVGFIISVVQDSIETAINSSGDVIFAATAEYKEWIKEGKEVKF